MSETIGFAGDPHIGVFTRVFEDIAIVAPSAPEEYIRALEARLGVTVVTTTIQGASIVGSLVAGNSRGMVVSALATGEEIAALSEHRDVMLLERGMNAAGNVILANDSVAVVHPGMSQSTAEAVGSFLDVPVLMMTLGGVRTVGMAGVATSRGILVHPRATQPEIEQLEALTDLPVGTGSINMGSALVGTGLVANGRGYLAGLYTSGYELGRFEEVFGFLE